MIFIYLLSGLFLGFGQGANALSNIFGTAVETRMITFRKAALIASIFIVLGAVIEGSGPSGTLGRLGSIDALGGAFTVSLAAAAAIFVNVRMGIPVSSSQTIVGAIIGWNVFSGRLTDLHSIAIIGGSWVGSFLLAAGIAALLFYAFQYWINHSKMHLLVQDLVVRYAIVIVGAFGAYSLGANNIANVVGVFVHVSPFKDLNLFGIFQFDGVQQLYILGSLSIVAGIYTYSRRVIRTVGKDLFELSPVTALVAILAEAIMLFLFSSQALHRFFLKAGIPPIPLVPVSSANGIIGAIMGIALAKGGKNIRFNVLGRISLAWITAPLMAFLFSFVALFIVQNVFEQTVRQPVIYTFNRITVEEIKEQGFDTAALATVNGRSFDSEQSLYKELKAQNLYDRQQLMDIIAITQEYPMQVNTGGLRLKGLHKGFTPQQWKALQQLDEHTFTHKWQLKQTLAEDESWSTIAKPSTELEKSYNSKIESTLELLYKSFYYTPKQNK
ncbi:MAG: inorganic phosphate transporter [Candidatus Cloacimonetes bacterium]|nr:inorganic phosphate transporter [Candidatus Cloacimonadota bacterium]